MIDDLWDFIKFYLVLGYYGSCLILLGIIVGDILLKNVDHNLTPICVLWFWIVGWFIFGDVDDIVR